MYIDNFALNRNKALITMDINNIVLIVGISFYLHNLNIFILNFNKKTIIDFGSIN